MPDQPLADASHGIAQPARLVPWPASISDAARAALAAAAARPAAPDWPALEDVAGWQARIADLDAMMGAMAASLPEDGLALATRDMGGATVHVARPMPAAEDGRVYLDLHGGGLIAGAGAFARGCAVLAALRHRVTAVGVDYRMPPAHPFPAGLDDCLAVYRVLVAAHGANNIVVGGASAGGNLAAALLLHARAAGLPMPAALVLMTPEVDLTESGDSFATLAGLDPVLPQGLHAANLLYAAGRPLDDPLLSPLFGDLAGFPPTFLQTGTRDLFLSNTVRMHRALRAAGVAAELHVFEGMPHGGFGGVPEDDEREREVARFVAAHWGRVE
ncbi:alpha/beta hydrolase fold domain-containing protein [Sphingomonas jatrophae]|uniref:Acetyl esterase/lipase n=1 Tax=Sphingomonas jatrophae TaxID=1166337 RepID=A0A1I6KHK3_9SPHN|nr:alpha/beta hydrolase fold domain-containing protein [Sphingomonas jatrophae]SFR90676.1 Acetyl esterase/lipase [Sphingomonas jatrophae]